MKRIALVVSISAALSGAVVACGDDAAETPAEPAQPSTESPPQPEETAVREAPPEQPAQPEQPEEPAEPVDQTDLECENDDVDCPMFEWMEANTKRAVEEGDVEAMAKAFHKIEFMTPVETWDAPEHGDEAWVQIARRGATLAEEGNAREARRMCKACHQKWRDAFREQGLRTRPMPELPPNAEQGRTDI